MNKWEREWDERLRCDYLVGEILWYSFEGIKLRLADNTFYTPDFLVMLKDGTLEAHEVKGWMRDDAAVKLKVAAEMFPLKFVLITKEKGQWKREEFS